MNLTNNNRLRTEILKRIKELDYTYTEIVNDANERNMPIKNERLSKYIKGKPGGLTEEQLIWLATRLGIYIHLNFGDAVIVDGKVTYKIGKFNELRSLQMVNHIFPPKEIVKPTKRKKTENG